MIGRPEVEDETYALMRTDGGTGAPGDDETRVQRGALDSPSACDIDLSEGGSGLKGAVGTERKQRRWPLFGPAVRATVKRLA